MHVSKVMLCIKKRDERTDGRMHAPEAICPSNFFEAEDIIMYTPVNPTFLCIKWGLQGYSFHGH